MKVFFYGLFMDAGLLATKDITPTQAAPGFVDGFSLRIGQRATLVRQPDGRAYGILMEITPKEAAELYAEESVADYLPEPVVVELMDGTRVDAICYNLPANQVTGMNRDYARSLLEVASRLNFPSDYLDQIRKSQV